MLQQSRSSDSGRAKAAVWRLLGCAELKKRGSSLMVNPVFLVALVLTILWSSLMNASLIRYRPDEVMFCLYAISSVIIDVMICLLRWHSDVLVCRKQNGMPV
jgi:hypothetical protein